MSVSEQGLAAMIAAIAPGAETRRVRPIGGGLASATYTVETTSGDFVMKLFRPHRHAEAPLEWERLTFAQRVAGIPVPEPVALDSGGRWFGAPAVVMSRLAGRVDVTPRDIEAWLRQLAHALAAIHATDTADAGGSLLDGPPLGHWEIGDWERLPLRRSGLVDRCVEAIRRHGRGPDPAPVLVHGDFHPGNVVWHGGRLAGVVDWSATRLGSREFELAYCRAGIALLLGIHAVRRLTGYYSEIAGPPSADLPVYDLMCGLVARQLGPTRWLPSYRQQGCTDTARQFAARMTPFLLEALAEIGA